MSREPLDDHLRRFYDAQEVDPTVLERLKQLAALENEGAGPGARAKRSPRGRLVMAAAALAALVLVALFVPGLRDGGSGGPEALAGSILREIALNHSKNLTVEFAAVGYPRLREQMAELDFSLRAPRRTPGGDLHMLGGRYCSIQGRLAAQIKLEDERGRVLTLYQTGFDDHFEGLPELHRELDGVEIRVWREGDLLYALAGSGI